MTHPTLKALFVGTAMLACTAPAAAAPDWGKQVVGTVGQYIAAQGNVALKQIHTEIQREVQQLKPIRVERPEPAQTVTSGGANALQALEAK